MKASFFICHSRFALNLRKATLCCIPCQCLRCLCEPGTNKCKQGVHLCVNFGHVFQADIILLVGLVQGQAAADRLSCIWQR